MSAWITDRVPTREDGDKYGGVMATIGGKVLQWDWAEIKLGTPWQPITYPEPYVKEPVWKWERVGRYIQVYVIGKLLWTINGQELTDTQADAMTDALNKLEDSHD